MAIRAGTSVRALIVAGLVAFGGSNARAESVGERCDWLAAGPDDPARHGEPVELARIDWRTAIMACRAAAAKNPFEAQWHYQLGRALLAAGLEAEAERAWGRAVIFQYPAALFELGRARMPRPGNLRTIYASDAYSLLWRAANRGHAGAAEAVGHAHEFGIGTVQSVEAAARWYAVAAAEGDLSAAERLAVMYVHGYGVRRDMGKAISLFELVANGDQAMLEALDRLRRRSDQVPRTP